MAKTSINKSRLNTASSLSLLGITIILFTLSSCIRKTEGCMDVLATNFRADVDLSCEDCCSYPNLSLSITHAAGDTTLNYTDTFQVEGQPLRILSTSFYAQNFTLANTADTVKITDNITLTDRSNNQHTVTDDILLISRNTLSSNYTIGTFPIDGNFQEFHFQLGLSDDIANTQPSSTPNEHPLSSELGLYELADSTYIDVQLSILDINSNDTLSFNISTIKNLVFSYSISINRGTNTIIPLKVDYLEWLKGINFADDYQSTKHTITENLTNAFSIKE